MQKLFSRLYRLIPRPLVRLLLFLVNPKFNLGAVGLFITVDNRILVLRHVFRHTYPWGLPGGYLNRGETAEAGMLRELWEETRLTAILERIFSVEDVDRFQKEVVFLARIDADQTPKPNFEIFEVAFVPCDQLPDGMLPRHAALVERYMRGAR
jgi:ADP-ribose pyrophosphatase YjhB (NUDIX family)